MCNKLLLFLFIWDISGHVSESYCFQEVRTTRNIMHVTLTFGGIEETYNMWEPSLN